MQRIEEFVNRSRDYIPNDTRKLTEILTAHTPAGACFSRVTVSRMVALHVVLQDSTSSPVSCFALLMLERLYNKSHFIIEREFKGSEGTIFQLPLQRLNLRGIADDTLALVADGQFSNALVWERLDDSSTSLSTRESRLNIQRIFSDPDLLFLYVLETEAGRALKQAQRENKLLGAARLCHWTERGSPVNKDGLIVSQSILDEVWNQVDSRKIKLQGEEISCFALEFSDSFILGVGIGFKEQWDELARAPLLQGAEDGGDIELQQVEFCPTDAPSISVVATVADALPIPPRPPTPAPVAPTTSSALVDKLSEEQSVKSPLESLLADSEMSLQELDSARSYLTTFSTAYLTAFSNDVQCAEAHIGRLTITRPGVPIIRRSALLMNRAAWPTGIRLKNYATRADFQNGRNEEEMVTLIGCKSGDPLDDFTVVMLFTDEFFQRLAKEPPKKISFEAKTQGGGQYILDKWSPPLPKPEF